MKISFAILIVCCSTSLFGQNQKELDSLYKILPQAKDTAEVNVLYSIARFEFDRDAPKAMHISKESLQKAKRLEFTNGQVMAYKQIGVFYNLYKNDLDSAARYLDSANVRAVTNAQKISIFTAYGSLYSQKGEFEKSHTYLMQALELISSKESRQAFHTYMYIALNVSRLGRDREAAQYYKRCVGIAEHNNNVRDIGVSLSNLGIAYMNMEEYDSALSVYKRLYAFEIKHGNPLLNPTLLCELGKLYFEKGQVDTSYYFMRTGLKAAYTMNIGYAITRSLSNLARFHLNHKPDSALFYGRKLYERVNRKSVLELADVYYILAEAHGKLRHYDSAFFYFDKYSVYDDSVFQEKQAKRIAELEAQFSLTTKQEEIQRLEAVHQNEVIKRNVLAAGLLIAVFIAILIFFIYRARIRARKKEIEVKNWQLQSFTEKMIEKSELVEELRMQIEQLKPEAVIPAKRIEDVSQMLNSSILTEDDWEQFKSLFSQVHGNFFAELKLKFPLLTQAEIRLAALVKLNLTTREMANMLGISMDSVNKARYRLRKKLEMRSDETLHEIIEGLSV